MFVKVVSMLTHAKDFAVTSDGSGMPSFARTNDTHLTACTRTLGILTAIVVCGVGADVAFHGHVIGFYVTAASGLIFFLEITWVITLFVQICVRNDESYCSRCWSSVLMITRGWRRALFYLPLSCILAWKPHKLWLCFVAAGLLAVLALLHIASSALDKRSSCNAAVDSVGERLLNSRPESCDRFEEVLVTEVLDDGLSGPTGRAIDSDMEIRQERQPSWASETDDDSEPEQRTCQIATLS